MWFLVRGGQEKLNNLLTGEDDSCFFQKYTKGVCIWPNIRLSKSAAPPNLKLPSFMFTYNLHANFTGSYEHFTWNRAKSFEVFSMSCNGLGSFMFTSVVPGDFAIQITFQALCSLILLLRHTQGLESVLFVNVSVQFICEHKTWKFQVRRCSGLGKAFVCSLWVPPNRFTPALAYFQL